MVDAGKDPKELDSKIRKVKLELKKMDNARPNVWSFLNSTFGIFLLSGIMLGGLGRFYGDYQLKNHDALLKNQQLFILTTEFDYRLDQIKRLSDLLYSLAGEDQVTCTGLIWMIVAGDKKYQPALPEFKDTHWCGIIIRLKLLGVSECYEDCFKALIGLDQDIRMNRIYDLKELRKRILTIERYNEALHKKISF